MARCGLAFLALLTVPGAATTVCNVMDHGASGDGVTVDTAALTAAIEACEGGGTVVIPDTVKILTYCPPPLSLSSYPLPRTSQHATAPCMFRSLH